MIRTLLVGSVLVAGLFFAGQPAQALTPFPALNATGASALGKVAWVCGPAQCVWDPTPAVGYVVPSYAATWQAPLYPGCYWKRGFLGRWRMICP